MQGKMTSPRKKRAQLPKYVSPNQLTLVGFENPFDQKQSPTNRWVVGLILSHGIKFAICFLNLYQKDELVVHH
jgi:hypothetical protein